MNRSRSNKASNQLTSLDEEAIRLLRSSIASGKNWYLSLLEAVGRWSSPEETYQGRHYQYLIEGTAFDWQLLAERLCEAVDGILPEKEKTDFLLRGNPPFEITKDQFQQLIGRVKYRQYLNYFYGIIVEDALLMAVKEEVRKGHLLTGWMVEEETSTASFRRIYGNTQSVLLEQFRKEKHRRQLKSISLGELKEFSYWLFHYRVKNNDKSRVASDTKKALNWLDRNGYPERYVITRQIVGNG